MLGWEAGLAVVCLALALLVFSFTWDWLRGPLSRFVSDRTGRHVEITRRPDVDLGRVTRVRAGGLVIANPSWAQEPQILRAWQAEVHLRLIALHMGADIRADLGLEGTDPLPFVFRAQGRWRGQPLAAQGRTGPQRQHPGVARRRASPSGMAS